MDILVVDDEKDIRDLVSGILSDEGYETRTAKDGVGALEQIQARQPHLVVLDVWLGDSERDGLKILDQIKRDNPFLPVIMISGHATIETAVSAIKKGAYDFIEKPFHSERLLILVERAIESSRLKRENAELTQKYIGENLNLVGTSAIANKLKQDIEKAANNNWRVFFSGPLGAMKGLLAQEIHKRSVRKDQPFIVVNCAQIHPSQLDVELFGLETMGGERRIGLLEKAHQGTIFFDEISCLPLPTQAKITRVLIEESFTRLGAQDKISINIRFMAGSSEDVLSLIQSGDLREDLFYRLNVMTIQIPSITARAHDFSDIVRAVGEQHAKRQGVKMRPFTDDAVAFLQSYSWPKNFVELRNVLERILIEVPGTGPIALDMLPANLFQKSINMLVAASEIVILPIKEAREIFEREYLQAQVNRFSGNITKTAKFIGMERSALHRKLKTLNLQGYETKGDCA